MNSEIDYSLILAFGQHSGISLQKLTTWDPSYFRWIINQPLDIEGKSIKGILAGQSKMSFGPHKGETLDTIYITDLKHLAEVASMSKPGEASKWLYPVGKTIFFYLLKKGDIEGEKRPSNSSLIALARGE